MRRRHNQGQLWARAAWRRSATRTGHRDYVARPRCRNPATGFATSPVPPWLAVLPCLPCQFPHDWLRMDRPSWSDRHAGSGCPDLPPIEPVLLALCVISPVSDSAGRGCAREGHELATRGRCRIRTYTSGDSTDVRGFECLRPTCAPPRTRCRRPRPTGSAQEVPICRRRLRRDHCPKPCRSAGCDFPLLRHCSRNDGAIPYRYPSNLRKTTNVRVQRSHAIAVLRPLRIGGITLSTRILADCHRSGAGWHPVPAIGGMS